MDLVPLTATKKPSNLLIIWKKNLVRLPQPNNRCRSSIKIIIGNSAGKYPVNLVSKLNFAID